VRALSTDLDVTRAGFAIVGARSAVERNRLRRRLRAALAPLVRTRPGLDLVLTIPAGRGNLSASALAEDLGEALAHASARLITS
jgi:ribonuclease P protein component